jgi:hypothetical protein
MCDSFSDTDTHNSIQMKLLTLETDFCVSGATLLNEHWLEIGRLGIPGIFLLVLSKCISVARSIQTVAQTIADGHNFLTKKTLVKPSL